MALVCVGLLSSCSLLPSPPPSTHDNNDQKAVVQMQHIADAVKNHDVAALKKLFSPPAQEKATDLDGGLEYFLSVFPSGRMTWKTVAIHTSTDSKFSKQTEEVFSLYKVSAAGKEYLLFFADFTVNEIDDPRNVGLYALGVTPYTTQTETASGAKKPFFAWEGSFQVDAPKAPGDPGIYVPQD